MTRPRSKHQLAEAHVESALSEASKALSRLGGKVRYRPKQLPIPNSFNARLFLESVINRLRVIQVLLASRDDLKKPVQELDPFELEYDRERDPQC